jgi:uncharacterized protein (UPF0335 family)
MHEAVLKIELAKRKTIAPDPPVKEAAPTNKGTTQQLRSMIDRIVRLEEEKIEIGAGIKDIYIEVKAADFNVKAVRTLVKREMEDSDQRAARQAVESEVEALTAALGDFRSSPLGEAAISRAMPI